MKETLIHDYHLRWVDLCAFLLLDERSIQYAELFIETDSNIGENEVVLRLKFKDGREPPKLQGL